MPHRICAFGSRLFSRRDALGGKCAHGLRWLAGRPCAMVSRHGRKAGGRAAALGRGAEGAAMSWMEITNYAAAHGLEIAGVVTTVLGIWLTTRRLLICWPITLAADVIYLVVFYRARLFSDTLLQD